MHKRKSGNKCNPEACRTRPRAGLTSRPAAHPKPYQTLQMQGESIRQHTLPGVVGCIILGEAVIGVVDAEVPILKVLVRAAGGAAEAACGGRRLGLMYAQTYYSA